MLAASLRLPRSVLATGRGCLLLGLMATSGCTWGANGAATAAYARQVSTANLRVSQMETQFVAAQERIEQLEEVIRLQGQSEATRLENLDQVNAEVTRLRGALEVLRFEIDALKDPKADVSHERRHLHNEKRLAAIEGFLGLKPPPPPTDDELGVVGTGEPGATDGATEPAEGLVDAGIGTLDLPATASGKLDLAAELMDQGKQEMARTVLLAAISAHEGAPEMDEIRYRYAETFMNEEKWRPAVFEFNKVLDNHPDSPWACWSYYRQGEAMEKLSTLQDAQMFYQGATKGACRNSDAARAAKKKL